MNQTAKYRRSWPVYVFLVAVMGLVTTMAAVQKQKKTTPGWVQKKPAPAPRTTARSLRAHHPLKANRAFNPAFQAELAEKPGAVLDSVRDLAEVTVVAPPKQSRYVMQQGNLLYWVITPKMTFNELIDLKQTIEKNSGFTFDFGQIKFDPLQLYIDAIEVKIHQEKHSAGSTFAGKENDDPIQSIGGYLSDRGSLGLGGLHGQSSFGMPAALEQLAKDDEKAVAAQVAENRMAYFILKNRKTGPGSSSTTTGQWLRENRERRNENLGVFINAENRLQLYQPDTATVLIDGREVPATELTKLPPERLHTVIVTDVRDDKAGAGREKRYVQLFLQP
ncbi:hypothetical protein GCM10027299_30240 [Larkinella ripae]